MAKTASAVAVRDEAELQAAAEFEALEAELAAQNQAEIDRNDIQIPLLKIGHGNTAEVEDGDANLGDFINALTRESLGRQIEFVVAGYNKGRFDHGIRGEKRARKAYATNVVPWQDDPFYGRSFTDHPDAEEQYSARVNAKEIEWGKGPRISTTYDFTGYVVPEGDEEPIPVCLSLMRMNTKQAKKWVTILDAVLQGKYWDAVFTLTTEQNRNDSGSFFTVNVKQARKTTVEEKQRAVKLAQVLRNRPQDVQVVGDADEAAPTAKPADTGGLEV